MNRLDFAVTGSRLCCMRMSWFAPKCVFLSVWPVVVAAAAVDDDDGDDAVWIRAVACTFSSVPPNRLALDCCAWAPV